MIKIIVDSEELKQQIIEESEYIHDFAEFTGFFKKQVVSLNSNKANTLMHIHKRPDLIEVINKDAQGFHDIDKFYVE